MKKIVLSSLIIFFFLSRDCMSHYFFNIVFLYVAFSDNLHFLYNIN